MVRKTKSKKWHDKKNIQGWFDRLTPEERLAIALQIEKFRREARLVED